MPVGIPRRKPQRPVHVTVTITAKEHARLVNEAFEKGLTVAELFRRKTLGSKD